MAFRIKDIKPMFSAVITTACRYVGETKTEGGLIDVSKRDGDLNPFQTVFAVGDITAQTTGMKKGDIVKLNFKRYAKAQHVPGAIDEAQNKQFDKMSITYELPTIEINGVIYLQMQSNDVEYIVTDYDGIEAGGLLQ